MADFFHMEDNEDGTVTITGRLFGEDLQSAIMPMSLQDLGFALMDIPTVNEAGQDIMDQVILIPDDLEEGT